MLVTSQVSWIRIKWIILNTPCNSCNSWRELEPILIQRILASHLSPIYLYIHTFTVSRTDPCQRDNFTVCIWPELSNIFDASCVIFTSFIHLVDGAKFGKGFVFILFEFCNYIIFSSIKNHLSLAILSEG